MPAPILGSGVCESTPDARERSRRTLAYGAQFARLPATAAGAHDSSVRGRPIPGGHGRSLAVQPGPRRRPHGDRRRLHRAVSALLAAGAVRRGADGPLGSAAGLGRRHRGAAGSGRRDRHNPGCAGRGAAAVVRGLARQWFGAIRHVRPGRIVAPRRAARTGRHNELGSHRDGRDRGVPRCQLHAVAPVARRRRRQGIFGNHLHRHDSAVARVTADAAVPPPRARPGRHPASDPRIGPLRGNHRLAARRADGAATSLCQCHPVRLDSAPNGGRYQLVAALVARPPPQILRGRRVGYRAGVLCRVGPRGLRGHRPDPAHGASMGALRNGEHRTDGGLRHPDRRRRAGDTGDGGVRLFPRYRRPNDQAVR